MSIYSKNNKFVSYLVILISIFILILFTKDQFSILQENLDNKESLEIELKEKKEVIKTLNENKVKSKQDLENISKYDIEIKEDEIINYLYSYFEQTNGRNGVVIIKNLSISETSETETGFKETKINLSIIVPNEKKLKTLLDFLTSSKSKYNFFIKDLSYPLAKTNGSFGVSIPLTILHK